MEAREKVLKDYLVGKEFWGGIKRFENATVHVIEELIEKNLLKPDDAQNDSPTAKEFLEFMQQYPDDVRAHGYIVSENRSDVRTTIEGLSTKCREVNFLIEWFKFNRSADELDETRSWWD